MTIQTPKTEAELLTRARDIAGLTIGDLCSQLKQPIPASLHKAKGFIGQLLEQMLGATASSKPEPDFQELGIELKTLPIDKNHKPAESTYICTAPLISTGKIHWRESIVYQKTAKILWVPIEADKKEIASRRIGNPMLWQANKEQEHILRQDWEELMTMITMGQLEQITARHGKYLQIRPKAANAKALTWSINENGEKILTLPRGFYLRTIFTSQLLQQYYC